MTKEEHGYEVLSGTGKATGQLLGGCIDVFPMVIGTEIWPTKSEWKDKILLLETSEEKPSPDLVTYYLRNLGAQGIFDVIKGIIIGKQGSMLKKIGTLARREIEDMLECQVNLQLWVKVKKDLTKSRVSVQVLFPKYLIQIFLIK